MTSDPDDIVRRDFLQGKVAYRFQWNQGNHKRLGNIEGDLAALWAHLSTICSGRLPEEPFTNRFYRRASSLKLPQMSAAKKISLRKRLMKSDSVSRDVDNDLVSIIRDYHKLRGERNYCADHGILLEFLHNDPSTIGIEVPVWSEKYQMSGHIDLVRYTDDIVQVCDYKPGPLTRINTRFLDSLPQVSAYGEMMTYHLAGTLRPALNAALLPKVQCCVFDSHSCWQFGAELFIALQATGNISDF